ncbi:methyltransferase domain-containing protein [Candidatus Micrarchaeota archaeon]|nr:methyltransferase domain-containing protein [Candidatus Micrarchaeota archaeon]
MGKNDILVRLNPNLKKLKRGPYGGPQIILPKDIGVVFGYTDLGRNSKIVEAGSGAGFFTVSLANICKTVYSYEVREDFYIAAKKNIEKMGMKNAKLKNKDISKGIKEKNVDAVFLDMPKSDLIVPLAFKAVKENGWIIGYLPNVEQVKEFYIACEKAGFKDLFVIESINREWVVREHGVRPQHKGLVHTAFIVFGRR